MMTQFTCAPRVYPLTEWTIAFTVPAEAGPHLPNPEWWRAELAWVAGYIRLLNPDTVTIQVLTGPDVG